MNGCFWHHHDCKYFVWPKNNSDFWKEKIDRNVARDQKNIRELEEAGWHVIIIWECALKQNKDIILKELTEMIDTDKKHDRDKGNI